MFSHATDVFTSTSYLKRFIFRVSFALLAEDNTWCTRRAIVPAAVVALLSSGHVDISEIDIEAVLQQLTLNEKVSLLSDEYLSFTRA